MSEIMDLEDAVRALKDRPSMESELTDLREFKRKFEAREDELTATCQSVRAERDSAECEIQRLNTEIERLNAENANLKRQLRDASGTIAAEVVELKGKCERLEASRKATLKAGWDAAIDTCAVKYGVTKSMFEAWWDAQTINEGVCE
jgi:chromosome segregation ATPase